MAKKKREPISPKTRMEVFKRDSFTCQYCGRKAPDVVLEVDHIKPVAKGGDNSIMNLITSCFECNRGKGKRELKDSSVIDKQHAQLKLMQEKRNQLQMMIEWKEEMSNIYNEQIKYFNDKFREATGFRFSVIYKGKLNKALKEVGFEIMFDAFEICLTNYSSKDRNVFADNVIEKLIGTTYNLFVERTDPKKASIRHIANTLKSNCTYFDYKVFYSEFNNYNYETKDKEIIMGFANTSNAMDRFFRKVEEYYESQL